MLRVVQGVDQASDYVCFPALGNDMDRSLGCELVGRLRVRSAVLHRIIFLYLKRNNDLIKLDLVPFL